MTRNLKNFYEITKLVSKIAKILPKLFGKFQNCKIWWKISPKLVGKFEVKFSICDMKFGFFFGKLLNLAKHQVNFENSNQITALRVISNIFQIL